MKVLRHHQTQVHPRIVASVTDGRKSWMTRSCTDWGGRGGVAKLLVEAVSTVSTTAFQDLALICLDVLTIFLSCQAKEATAILIEGLCNHRGCWGWNSRIYNNGDIYEAKRSHTTCPVALVWYLAAWVLFMECMPHIASLATSCKQGTVSNDPAAIRS